MAKVGDLVIDLRADIADFKVGMSRAQQEIQKTAAVLKREMRQQSKDAKDSLDLLSDTIGVRLPRELRNFLAETKLVRPAMAAAFNVSVVAGFAGIFISQLVPAIQSAATAMGGFSESVKRGLEEASAANARLVKNFDELKKAQREVALAGTSGEQRKSLLRQFLEEDTVPMEARITQAQQRFQAAQAELQRVQRLARAGGIGNLAVDDAAAAASAAHLELINLGLELEVFKARSEAAIKGVTVASVKGVKEVSSALTGEQKRLQSGQFGLFASVAGIGRLDLSPGLAPIARSMTLQDSADTIKEITEGINRQADAVGNRLTKAWEAQQKAIEAAAASARKFGEDVGSSLKELIIHGGNARQIFLALAQDVFSFVGRKFILPGAGDGFFGSLLGGLFGGARAMGGPVLAGGSYLVGEQGPELFVPNVSGSIVPNNSMGGVSIVINQDNRGADAEAMLRARQSIEQSAATLAVQVMAARKARS